MKLSQVAPWGRNLKEYTLMFNLSQSDLKGKMLGCGDGPASFNAEITALGYDIVSVDPLYSFSAAQIKKRVYETYDVIISQVEDTAENYVWQNFRNPEELGKSRLATMERFLLDYDSGKLAGRYLPQSLPHLNFADHQFDLCLCSHLLFLYSHKFSLEFHIASLQELLRICREVRIFPLLQLNHEPSPYLKPVLEKLNQISFQAKIETVGYEFQKGANQMLKIVPNPGK